MHAWAVPASALAQSSITAGRGEHPLEVRLYIDRQRDAVRVCPPLDIDQAPHRPTIGAERLNLDSLVRSYPSPWTQLTQNPDSAQNR